MNDKPIKKQWSTPQIKAEIPIKEVLKPPVIKPTS